MRGGEMPRAAEIVYLHGLESGPTGSKGSWLTSRHGAVAVDLDTRHARASKREAARRGVPWDHTWPGIEEDFRVPMERARAAIGPQTRLVVGSSFGGAVLTRLLAEGHWAGPSLLIASAGVKLTGRSDVPAVPVLLLHGRDDDVIPLAHSRRVADQGGPEVMLWEIGDGHRMKSILESGMLDLAVQWLCGRGN